MPNKLYDSSSEVSLKWHFIPQEKLLELGVFVVFRRNLKMLDVFKFLVLGANSALMEMLHR